MYPNEVLKKLARSKGAGKPDQMYDLSVPTGDAQAVANVLAQANVDFDVNQSYSNGVTTYFVMPNEAEHHAAETILRDKFQKSITNKKPIWDEWSEGAEMPDPSEVMTHPLMKTNASRVRIREGSGIDSNKEGEIISWDSPEAMEVRNNYPFVGGRTPESMNWVAIKLESGEVVTQPRNNVTRVKSPGVGSPEFLEYYTKHPGRHAGAAAAPAFFPLSQAYLCGNCEMIGNSSVQCPACQSRALESVENQLGGSVGQVPMGPNAKPKESAEKKPADKATKTWEKSQERMRNMPKPIRDMIEPNWKDDKKEAGIPDFDKELLIEHLSGLDPEAIVEDIQNHFGPGAAKEWALAVAREMQGPSQEPDVEAEDKDAAFWKESDPRKTAEHPLEQGYPKYEIDRRPMRDWEDAQMYLQVHGGTLMEKIDAMTPWHVLQTRPKTSSEHASHMASGLFKTAVGDVLNQTCPNCENPIKQGEMVNWTSSGSEAHVHCPPHEGGGGSRIMMPSGFKPKPQNNQNQNQMPRTVPPELPGYGQHAASANRTDPEYIATRRLNSGVLPLVKKYDLDLAGPRGFGRVTGDHSMGATKYGDAEWYVRQDFEGKDGKLYSLLPTFSLHTGQGNKDHLTFEQLDAEIGKLEKFKHQDYDPSEHTSSEHHTFVPHANQAENSTCKVCKGKYDAPQHSSGSKMGAKRFGVYDDKFKRMQPGSFGSLNIALAEVQKLEAEKGAPGEERFIAFESRPGINQMTFQFYNQKGEPIDRHFASTLSPEARIAVAKGRKVRLATGERVERSIEKIAFNVKTAKVQVSQGQDEQGFHMLVNLNGTEYVLRGADAEQFRKDYAAIQKPEEKVNALVERYLGKLQRYAPAAKKPPVQTQEDRAKGLQDADNYWAGKGAPEQQADSEAYYEGKGAPKPGQAFRRYTSMTSNLFASDEAPDDGPDYYDFPKNWKEEETEETHDRKHEGAADALQTKNFGPSQTPVKTLVEAALADIDFPRHLPHAEEYQKARIISTLKTHIKRIKQGDKQIWTLTVPETSSVYRVENPADMGGIISDYQNPFKFGSAGDGEATCRECGDPLNNANGPCCNGKYCAKSTDLHEGAADDMCNACGKEVANRECDHGLLCDKCDEQVHGSVGGPCDLSAPPKKETPEGYDKATPYAPTPEDLKRWAGAIHRTYSSIGQDANLEGERPWVVLQVCLDADHTQAYGGLKDEDYKRFQDWFRAIFAKKGYETGLKYVAKALGFTGRYF